MKKNIFIILFVAFLCINSSCEKFEVVNLNLPDRERVMASPNDVKEVVQASFHHYWQAIKTYNIGMTSHVMADHTTASWGGWAWLDMSKEPRIAWNNDPSYGNAYLTQSIYYDLYTVISNVNDALRLILIDGYEIGHQGSENNMIEASAYLIRGMSLGQLGLTYDKCMIPHFESDNSNLEFQPWNTVIEAAIDDLKRAIQLCQQKSFEWPAGTINGVIVDNVFISKLANSYAARFLSLGARNKLQNDDLSWTSKYDWSDVIDFTQNGLTDDFSPVGNGVPWHGGTWWDLNIKYLRQPGWGRVDCRIVNLLDPDYPVRYPTDEKGLPLSPPQVHNDLGPGRAKSSDARFITDFQFLQSNNFRPERGGWHFSHYRHSRYDFPATTNNEGNHMGESIGPLRELRAYDNQLMLAEALARANMLPEAAAILNNPSNPRIARGGLAEVNVNKEEILYAIFYERDIELAHNGYNIAFCDMRRRDMLQYGTPLHFPIPGRELINLNIAIYTFGGEENADGVNTSIGGDWIKPYYHFTPSW